MCRNIKPLFNFQPKATQHEVEAAAQQYVKKISGYQKPSKINEEAFNKAIQDISQASQKLLDTLQTNAPKRNREQEAQKAKLRHQKRFS